jgi:hypothetical protein
MRAIQWRWVLVGIVFIYGSQLLLGAAIQLFGAGVEHLQAHEAIFLGFTLFTFFLGGFVVGLLSPGTTIVEPPLAALAAALLDAALPPPTAAQAAAGSWPVIIMIGLLLAFVGGWMGERLPTPTNEIAPHVGFWFALLVLVFGLPATMVAAGVPTWITAVFVAGVGGFVYWRLTK